jgi:hypothetical protein
MYCEIEEISSFVCSFSIMKYIVGCKLLNSCNVSSIFVLFVYYWVCHRHTYSMLLLVVFLGWGKFVCAPYVVYIFLIILLMLEPPLLIHQFVYSILDKIENNIVLTLFPICVLFLFGYFPRFHNYFYVIYYVFDIFFWNVCVHVLYVKGT